MILAAKRTVVMPAADNGTESQLAASGHSFTGSNEPVSVLRWQPLRESRQTAASRELALVIADRLLWPAQVEAAVVEARLQSTLPNGGPQWAGYRLAQGYAGLALLFGHLDRCFPGDGWDSVAHRHLEIAVHDAATRRYLPPGLFEGLGGLAFTASYLSQDDTRYQRLLATLDHALIDQLKPLIAEVRQQRLGSTNAFDLISGLSGAGLYLLSRRGSPGTEKVLDQLVCALIELSREDDGLPRWHTSSHLPTTGEDTMLRQFPNGYLNCGLAHGIPGPLAVLALSHLAGLRCAGLGEAIHRLAGWVIAHRYEDQWGINWPDAIGLLPTQDSGSRIAPVEVSRLARAGWCYGSPGVSRSLYLAGLALRSREYCDLAVAAAEAVLRRPVAMRGIDSPTFCHGVAGLLQILLRFANDTGAENLRAGASMVADQLLALYEPESLLGYRSIELHAKHVDQPGLLDGAPGVALVLLAVACPVEPHWDRAFLLS
jgi:lantibiotic modifying enzyme